MVFLRNDEFDEKKLISCVGALYMVSYVCCLSLFVGCCYDYEKLVEFNELFVVGLGGLVILFMENSVVYFVEFYFGRSIF